MDRLKYGMVGGGPKSEIGGAHRDALAMDPRVELVSGCFSRNEEKNNACGDFYSIDSSRLFTDWHEMLESEKNRTEDRIDFVVICTPNYLHYEMCKAFLEAGINVACEKPLCFEVAEAEELRDLAAAKKLIFAVTYTYTGYNMVKVMRQMIQRGDIGEIVSVNAEFIASWLLGELSRSEVSNKNVWRTDPKYTGISNAVGDIGTHMADMVSYVTGLKIKRLCATVDRYGKLLDSNDNILVEYENGVHGAYWCSQVAAGKMNGNTIRIYGTKGALEWEQHFPDYVRFTKHDEAPQILSKGCAYLDVPVAANNRIPCGHPEGFFCAFANIYKNFVTTIIKLKAGETPTEEDLDFPTAERGVEGVKFVHAVIESGDNDSKWVYMN